MKKPVTQVKRTLSREAVIAGRSHGWCNRKHDAMLATKLRDSLTLPNEHEGVAVRDRDEPTYQGYPSVETVRLRGR